MTASSPSQSVSRAAASSTAQASWGGWRGAALVALFLASGATALVYEVVWFKRLAHVWGAAPIAIASVVASFLLGLGLGAAWVGRWADRARRPLAAYGWFELGIGLFAFCVPFELRVLGWVEAQAYPLVMDRPLLGAAMRCALTFLVLGPPCFLMGGTLPLLVKEYTRGGGGLGRATGLLYALNTLGAATGAYLAGFHLLAALGIQGTTLLAVGANGVIGVAAIALARLGGGSAPASPEENTPASPPRDAATGAEESEPADPGARAPLWATPAVAFALGFAALVLQIVWMRQMALVVGGSTYAFTAVLVVILLGIAAGSLVFRAALEPRVGPGRGRGVLQGLVVLLGSSIVVSQLALPLVTDMVSTTVKLRQSLLHNAAICMLAGAAVAFVPSLLFGCLFPAVVASGLRAPGAEGRAVGTVSFWNTAGCLAGATVTPLVLIPWIGTHAAVGVALGAAFSAALLAEALSARGVSHLRGLALAGVAVALVVMGGRAIDPLRLNLGTYSSGYLAPEEQREELLFFAEGRACNVLVTEMRNRALRLNGKVDAGSGGDMPTQLGCAYFARFLRPAAKDALVLGFGSGTTSGALLLDPEARVTCCEIEAEVYAASEFFHNVNHAPEEQPGFTARVTDGRSHLQGADEAYDLVVSVPSNPWVSGIGNLFTRGFYRAAKARLRDGGMLVQWVQTYEQQPDAYAMILRTIASEFRHVGIVRIDDLDTLVVASETELLPDTAGLEAAQAWAMGIPEVATDLVQYYGTTNVSRLLMRHFIAGPDGVRRVIGNYADRTLHTDDNLLLELGAARRLFAYTPETDALALSGVDGSWQRTLHDRLPDAAAATVEWRGLCEALEAAGTGAPDKLLAAGYRVAPGDPFLLMRETLRQPPPDGDPLRERVLGIADASPMLANRLGGRFWQAGDYRRAEAVFRILLERWPDSATLWANLSTCRRPVGDAEAAYLLLKRALDIDPWNEFATDQRREHGDG